jgi:ABC-2 type transport system permease protein
MRRRLDIGASLIVTPDLLFLDDPTAGMDPRSQMQVWELVHRIAAAGTTVLLTTQYLEEADQLAGQIAVIDHGRIVAEGTSAQLKARVGSGTLHVRLLDGEQRSQAQEVLARTLEGPVQLGADPLTLSMLLATPADPTDVGRLVGHAMTRLSEARVAVAEVTLGQRSLQEAFLAITGHPASRHRPRGCEFMSNPTATTSRAVPETDRLDGLLAPGEPPRRAGALAASATFGWRAMVKIKREPKQLTDSIAIPVLFTVLFTYLFGGTPGNYLKTLLPGTLVMGITIVTMYGGARLAQTGVFDRFRSLSIWRGALVLGGLFGGAPGVIAAMALVIAFGLSLSWLWAAVALLVRDPATVTSIGAAGLIPPTFASNIFVKTSTMPGWLQAFVNINPVSHLTAAARDLMNSTGDATGPVVWSLIATAVITLVFAPLTLHIYSKYG